MLFESNFFRAVTTLLESEEIIYLLYVDVSMYEKACRMGKSFTVDGCKCVREPK